MRRGYKIQPEPEGKQGSKGSSNNAVGRVLTGDEMACEKINTNGSANLSAQRPRPLASETISFIPPTTDLHPMPWGQSTSSPKAADLSLLRSNYPEQSELYEHSGGKAECAEFDPSDTSFDDLTESSADFVDVPDLVNEDSIPIYAQNAAPLSSGASRDVLPLRDALLSNGSQVVSPTFDGSLNKVSPRSTNQQKSALKSSLKSSWFGVNRKQLALTGRPSTERRVRGLWNDSTNHADCQWNKLRDETVVHIMGFLNLAETLKVSMLAKRYRSLAQSNKQLWHSVDATEFVEAAHTHFLLSSSSISEAQERTGHELETVLKQHRPISLTIRNIHNRLSAHSYLPSVSSLQELSLSHFEDLTDTHAHVLLLMTLAGTVAAAAKKRSNSLRKLELNHCPRLTNASVRSIVSQCPMLEVLSLQGCSGITNVAPLAGLLLTETKPRDVNLVGATPPQPSMLMNMFAPPPRLAPVTETQSPQNAALMGTFSPPSNPTPEPPLPAPSILSNMFAPPSKPAAEPLLSTLFGPPSAACPARPVTPPSTPPRTTNSPTPASSLQSLFAPPGMSPQRKSAPSVPSLPTMGRGLGMPSALAAGGAAIPGKLQELDLQRTGTSPAAVLKLFQTATDGNTLDVSLRSLRLDGNQWNDGHLEQLCDLLLCSQLSELSLECSPHLYPNDGSLTDDALIRLAGRVRFSKLSLLNLSGQHRMSGTAVAKFLGQAPRLSKLICQRMPNLLHETSATPLMKRLSALRKKQLLQLVDLRECELEPLVLELVKSTLVSPTDFAKKPVQLVL